VTRARLSVALLAVLSAAGCSESEPVTVTVLTRNLYLGADIDQAIEAVVSGDPAQIVAATTTLWATVQYTDFPARAQKVADEVAAAGGPDFVGLQEVALWRTQDPADFVPGNATTVAFDFLELVLNALSQRGLHYVVAAQVQDSDVEAPAYSPAPPDPSAHLVDVRFTDRDVILAKQGIAISNPRGANYAAAPALGGGFSILRGWVSTDAEVGGRSIRVVSTHLEVETRSPPLYAYQQTQCAELIQLLAPESRPTLLLGDMNSDANGTDTASYAELRRYGFGDPWADLHAGDPGLTCCQPGALNASVPFKTRIDLTLYRHGFKPTSATRFGQDPVSGLPGGLLWPTDHAGMAASFTLED
jgi:hypothetical protein